jgi:hypothetical protein
VAKENLAEVEFQKLREEFEKSANRLYNWLSKMDKSSTGK